MGGIEGVDVMGQFACTEDKSLERGDAGDGDGGNSSKHRRTTGRGSSNNKTDTTRVKPGDRVLQQTATHNFKLGDLCRARYKYSTEFHLGKISKELRMSGRNGVYRVQFDDGDEDEVVMLHVRKRIKKVEIQKFHCPVCDYYQVCCIVSPCVALCCSVLRGVFNEIKVVESKLLRCSAVHCSMLECVAVCCSVRPMKSKSTNQSRPNRI